MSRLLTRLSVAVAAGSAVLAAALPAAAATHPAPSTGYRSTVALTRIQYDAPGADTRSDRSLNGEWVTVTNRGRRAVDLSGWTLSSHKERVYRFRHFRLAAHASVRVHTGRGRDTSRDLYEGHRDQVWDNRSDTATLRDARGRTVATRSYGRPAPGGGHHGQQHGKHHGGDHRR